MTSAFASAPPSLNRPPVAVASSFPMRWQVRLTLLSHVGAAPAGQIERTIEPSTAALAALIEDWGGAGSIDSIDVVRIIDCRRPLAGGRTSGMPLTRRI